MTDVKPVTIKPVNTVAPKILTGEIILAKEDVLPIARTTKAIDISNPQEVMSYGSQKSTAITNFADTFLENMKVSNLGAAGDKMTEIVTLARSVNISELNNTTSKVPLLGKFIDSIMKKREKIISRFNTVKAQIETSINEVSTMSINLKTRINQMDAMYDLNLERYNELGKDIEVAENILELEKKELEAAKLALLPNDAMGAQKILTWQNDWDRFDRRIASLRTVQATCVQLMPMIRKIQDSAFSFIEKFNMAQELVFPQWKTQFVIDAILQEELGAAGVAKSIDDLSNELYLQNFKNMNEASVSAAKAINRNVYDVETLTKANEMLINTFNELEQINAQARSERAALPAVIDSLNKQLHNGIIAK